jgi:hypothetical protein
MALTKGQDTIELSDKSVGLLSLKISNQNKPSYQLEPFMVFIDTPSEEVYRAHLADIYRSEKDSFNEYLLSFDLNPGSIKFDKMWVVYKGILVGARADVPLDLKVDIKPNSVNYLGHIDVVLREIKSDDEERAGLFPLIDAGLVGFSTGTFDLTVQDRFDEDMKSFNSEFPGLQKVTVEKAILPQWTRPEDKKKL